MESFQGYKNALLTHSTYCACGVFFAGALKMGYLSHLAHKRGAHSGLLCQKVQRMVHVTAISWH